MSGLNKPMKPSDKFHHQVVSVSFSSLFLVLDIFLENVLKTGLKYFYKNLGRSGMNNFHPGLKQFLTNLKNKTNVSHSKHKFMFIAAVQWSVTLSNFGPC